MKRSAIILLSGTLPLLGVSASCKGGPPAASQTDPPVDENKSRRAMKGTRINLRIGGKTFAATLGDNPAASAFKAMLPLSLEMRDLHGNEKVSHLPSRLPSNDLNPGTIRTGDLRLWDSKSVVLFYKTFPTPYRYTQLGSIDDPDGLSAAVGTRDVTIKFEAE